MNTIGDSIGIWIAAGLTLVMFSFIYKDNPLFKFGEHLYLGISVGYYINVNYWNVFMPDVYRKIAIEHNLWVIIPAILGIFILLRLVPSISWLSRMAFAFYIGGTAGFAIPNVIHGAFLPQLSQTLRPFDLPVWSALLTIALLLVLFGLLAGAVGTTSWARWTGVILLVAAVVLAAVKGWIGQGNVNQVVILIGVFTVLIFFFFSLEHKKLVGSISKVGLVYIMVAFGAAFGYTVMARISLLIGRFQFLIYDWINGEIVQRFIRPA